MKFWLMISWGVMFIPPQHSAADKWCVDGRVNGRETGWAVHLIEL
ncbi:MAG: hypothetical protein WCE63_17925 [Acidobacteriaceae bacterium]